LFCKKKIFFKKKKNTGPFSCLQCNEEVILKTGDSKINHFAHTNPLACDYSQGESDLHRRCKTELYEALLQEPGVSKVALERPLGTVRPDVSAIIKGVKVAIEVQISSLSIEMIMARTIAYHQKGIYVLWLLPWTPELDQDRYAPSIWEKWIHACYFGRVYYWKEKLNVLEYEFEPSLKTVERKSWINEKGKKVTVGGYAIRSVRFRHPIQKKLLNLVRDFGPRQRYWWEGGGIKVPDASLFIQAHMRGSRSESIKRSC
jgi:competence protein CoiA